MTDRVRTTTYDRCPLQFPRVVLTFDNKTLTLSTECVEALESLREKNAQEITETELGDFFEQFGVLGSYLTDL